MRKTTRWALTALLLLAAGIVLVVAVTAWSLYQRGLQVGTFARMQTIAWKLDVSIRGGLRSEPELLSVVKSVANGRDTWGRKLVLVVRPSPEGVDYVLVSKGRDGKLDLPDFADYFSVGEVDVRHELSRDIIFRNGTPITNAGK
jgi:hypothetical protein